jgi:hypothetical protein
MECLNRSSTLMEAKPLDATTQGDGGSDKWALSALRSRRLLFGLIGVGILLRVAQYLANRSLWVDEAWLALNLLSRSFEHLTKPLDFAQGAPVGFLFTQEVVSRVLGFSEYALRLFPLLCGITSLIAFAWLARRVLSEAAAPLAVLLFAVADGLIYYSSELKPYVGDVAASVVLVIAARKLAEHAPGPRTGLLALGGLVLVLFSFPAVFFIAAVAATLTFQAIFHGSRAPRLGSALAVSLWLLGSIAVGAFAATRLDQIRSGSPHRFLGVTGSSSLSHAVNVFGTNVAGAMGLLQDPPFSQVDKIALLLVVVGIVSLMHRDRVLLSILLIPFPLTFVASAVHAYPLSLRTELFLAPPIILLLVEGVAKTVQWTPRRWKSAAALTLVVVLAGGPVFVAAKRLVHPRQREEIRPVLEFVRDHWQAGDTLYLQHYAQYAFLYYEKCGCLRLTHDGRMLWPVRETTGPDEVSQAIISETPALVVERYYARDPRRYVADLRRLKGRGRVWFLYSHVATAGEKSFIQHDLIGELNEMGVLLNGIDRPGAHAYLYDLR